MQLPAASLPPSQGESYARRQGAFTGIRHTDRAYAIACWWTVVLATCIAITAYGEYFIPERFRNDAWTLHDLLNRGGLWDGLSYDGYVNTARAWQLVLLFMPEQVALVGYAVLVVVAGMYVLDIRRVQSLAAQAMAGTWLICAAVFLAQPSKENVALPVALFFCLPSRLALRWLAALVFIGYAVFFRQYWAITLFYDLALLFAFRLHRSGRPKLAIAVAAVALVIPFVGAELLSQPPLTDARSMVNEERVADLDTRTAFSNPIVNTGAATDVANALWAWLYLNVPIALASQLVTHYFFFALFQIASVVFFVRGCRRCLHDLRTEPLAPDTNLAVRCAALVIAYSMTQSIFDPDFGTHLRHQIVVMLPMLVVGCYRR
jgi:hypothetical protein